MQMTRHQFVILQQFLNSFNDAETKQNLTAKFSEILDVDVEQQSFVNKLSGADMVSGIRLFGKSKSQIDPETGCAITKHIPLIKLLRAVTLMTIGNTVSATSALFTVNRRYSLPTGPSETDSRAFKFASAVCVSDINYNSDIKALTDLLGAEGVEYEFITEADYAVFVENC